jgi:hypothetical protein
MQINIQVVGLPSLIARLGHVVTPAVLAAPMKRAQELVRARMADYPPPPPDSTYIRTGNLGRSWAAASPIEAGGSMIGVIASTDVDYAGFVQGDPSGGYPSQATIHKDRWQTDVQVINALAPEIGRDFTATIQAELNS